MSALTPAMLALRKQCTSIEYNLLDPSGCRYSPSLYLCDTNDRNFQRTNEYTMGMAQCGIALHQLFQGQTFRLLEAATDPLTIDERTLSGAAIGERLKPPITLTAKVNTKGTLEVFWGRHRRRAPRIVDFS